MQDRWPYSLDDVLAYATSSPAARDALAEAIRQHDQLGYTPEHDDAHSLGDWAYLFSLRLVRLSTPDGWAGYPSPSEAREYLAELAAMAIRVMESLDRAHDAHTPDGVSFPVTQEGAR